MPSITPEAVAQLRARTGVGIVAVKQALEDAGGDEEKAIELLRKRGMAQAVKKATRDQSEGGIFIAEAPGKAALIVLKCETDFVGRSDGFIAMGQELANTLAKSGAAKAKTLAESKIPEAVQKLGENISMGETLEVGSTVIGSYVHSNRKIGVIIGMESGDAAKAKDVAMHAAAMNPSYLHPDDVTPEAIAKEKEIWKEQMKNPSTGSGQAPKPPEILEKIMLGKERKFREENALTKQAFVKDTSMTIEKYLAGAKIVAYHRVAI